MKKAYLALLLVVCLCLSCLASCGNIPVVGDLIGTIFGEESTEETAGGETPTEPEGTDVQSESESTSETVAESEEITNETVETNEGDEEETLSRDQVPAEGFVFKNIDSSTCIIIAIGYNSVEIDIPEQSESGATIVGIGAFAAQYCTSLKSVNIPKTVKDIDASAFAGCSSLESINVAKTNKAYSSDEGNLYSADKKTLITYAGGQAKKEFEVPSKVTKIGHYAFYDAHNLEALTLTFIGEKRNSSTNAYFGFIFGAESEENNGSYVPANIKSVTITKGTKVGDFAFDGCSKLTGVTLPATITNISSTAFNGCDDLYQIEGGVYYVDKWAVKFDNSKNSVSLRNDTVGIADSSFANGTALESISLPNGIKYIGKSAFEGCSNITSITIPNNVTTDSASNTTNSMGMIGASAFKGCSKLESIKLPFIGEPKEGSTNTHFGFIFGAVNSSENAAFVPESLKTVELNGASTIAEKAFEGCNGLKNIVISQNVTSISFSAFVGCTGIENITVSSDNKQYASLDGNLYDNGKRTLIQYAVGKTNTSFAVPASVTKIGPNAFAGASNLESLTVPFVGETKDGISNNHFGYIFGAVTADNNSTCVPSNLKTLVVSGGTVINDKAFIGCSNLESITIADSITQISSTAFDGCDDLYQIEGGIYYVDKWAVKFDNSVASVSLRNNTVGIADSTFANSEKLTGIAIGSNIKHIGSYAFENCANLATLTFEDDSNCVNIGSYAFSGCNALTEVTLPNSVENVGALAFNACKNLSGITLSSKLKSISPYMFADCIELETIVIPESVTLIDNYAFYGCISLKNITVPAMVTSIGDSAFSRCSNLDSVIFADNSVCTSIGEYAFADCEALKSITLAAGIKTISKFSFQGCANLTSIVIPESATSIEYAAFSGCEKLENISIPVNVTSISTSAFKDCKALKSVNYLGSEEDWANISIDDYENEYFMAASKTYN